MGFASLGDWLALRLLFTRKYSRKFIEGGGRRGKRIKLTKSSSQLLSRWSEWPPRAIHLEPRFMGNGLPCSSLLHRRAASSCFLFHSYPLGTKGNNFMLQLTLLSITCSSWHFHHWLTKSQDFPPYQKPDSTSHQRSTLFILTLTRIPCGIS